MSHVSFSELKIWKECPWKHKLVYLDKLKGFEGNEHTAFGTAIHSTYEKALLNESIDLKSVDWGAHVQTEGSLFYWMFFKMLNPLSATMFALLAFFVASASYRAFRIRNFEATLLLISGVLLMLGRVPIGGSIPWYFMIIVYVSCFYALIASRFNKKNIFLILYLSTNLLFILIMGFGMSLLMTLIITYVNTGLDNGYINRFLKAWAVGLPIAITAALLVGPIAKKFVDKITK